MKLKLILSLGKDALVEFFLCFQVTVFKQHASKLAALNERLIGIKVGDFW
jgi:hypothetical protein